MHRSGGPTPPPSCRRSPRRCAARRRSTPRNSPDPGARSVRAAVHRSGGPTKTSHRPIVGARDDVPPVAAQGHGSYHTVVPSQLSPSSGLEVPHRHRPVAGARDDVPPVAAHTPRNSPNPWCPVSSRAAVHRSGGPTPPPSRRRSPRRCTARRRSTPRNSPNRCPVSCAAVTGLEVPHRPCVGARDDGRPSPLNATEFTHPVPSQLVQPCTGLEVPHRHRPSSEPETMYRPSPLNATELTPPWCPVSSCSRAPVWRSHTATVPS